MPPEDVDALADELYALPLERFVAERDVLVKALRAEGRREDAASVAALPKPSVAAWSVNQVVRAQPDEAAALWAAGDEVIGAQERVVAGEGSGADLRAAVEAERRALAPLAEAARGLMTGSGKFLGEPSVQAVIESLHAAAIDPSVREDVALGRLARPVTTTGLAAAGGGSSTPQRERLPRRKAADETRESDRRREERERRARKQAAEQALARAERERDRARDRIAELVRERDRAAAQVEAAQRALAGAEEALTGAHEALERAEDVVDAARSEVRSA